ncbi:hypothetical protein MKX03_004503 [Papaver bracteatum]|nr:hypothetical protein MKX03_004503 [Papaver bracteatum]
MAMRVILTKRSPFGSSKTLGFVEGAQRIRRCVFDLDAYRRGYDYQGIERNVRRDELRKVNWDKYSRNVRPFELTRTGEMERLIQKMMDKEFEDRDDERIDVKLDAKQMEAVEKMMHDDTNKEDSEEKRIGDETNA